MTVHKRTLTLAALAALALLAWVAAPALSLRPYQPEIENFERGLPEPKRLPGAESGTRHDESHGADDGEEHDAQIAGHAGEEPRFISPPVKAPHEFDLVGVAREMRGLELRVRSDGGPWSDWVEQTEGTPVYVDGADEAQVRASFRPQGRLHFVNVSGSAGGLPGRLLSTARSAINDAFIAVASPTLAKAGAPQPDLVVRSAWGADTPEGGCVPKGPPELGEVRSAVIHHTVNANTYTPEEAAGIVLGICSFHIAGNGWNDIGYNALVDRFGTLYEGRAGGLDNPVVGAHAQGFNSQTTSIASVGEHSAGGLEPAAQASVVRYLAWRMAKAGLNPVTKKSELTSGGGSLSKYGAGNTVSLPRILGHGDLGLTACPGAALAGQIASIRRQVQKRLGGCRPLCKRCKKLHRGTKKKAKACSKCRRCRRKAKTRRLRAKRRAAQARRAGTG